MKRLIVLLVFAFSVYAQSQPQTINGHTLGESLAVFQSKEMTAKPRKYDHDGNTVITASSKRIAFDIPNGSKAPGVGNTVAVFEDGNLVFLQVRINNNPTYADFILFEDAQLQLTQKFGPCTNSTDVLTENKLGVTFHQRLVWWVKPDFFVQIVEAKQSSTLTLMTLAEHQREMAEQVHQTL